MNSIELEWVRCNLCGANEAETIYASCRGAAEVQGVDVFRSSGDEQLADPLVRCRHCGLEYVNPRVDSKNALAAYANSVDRVFVSQASARERTFRRCLRILQKHWRRPPGVIMDIGSANGSFLKVAKDAGWQVHGCEPNRWMTEWCRETYGIKLTAGTISDCKYDPGSFDIITLWDVLEHTPDPKAMLQECHRLLKRDGLLVINYPDIGSWVARAMGRKWVFLLTVHYYYFTRRTMRGMLAANGWQVVQMAPHWQYLELDYVLARAIPYVGAVAKVAQAAVRASAIGRQMVPYWVGQTLVIARKAK